MEISDELLETFEKYLANRMSAEEVKAFEARILADENLASQLQLFVHAQAAIDAKGHELLSENLEALGRKLLAAEHAKPVRRLTWVHWSSIAAVLLVLIAIAWTLLQNRQSVPPQQLFAAHFDLLPPSTSRSTESDSVWQQGMSAYAEGNYQQAINVWESGTTQVDSSETHLYLGLSYIMENQQNIAIDYLKRIDPSSSMRQRARWYLALAYVKAEDIEEAKTILENIATSPDHYQQEIAKEILGKLE